MSTAAHPAVEFSELAPAATPAPPAAAPETPAAPATPAEPTPQFTEADATAYRQMVDAGITPQNYQDFLQSKQALNNLDQILRTNPDLLFDQIQRTDPALHKQLLEKVSDRWFQQLPPDQKGTAQPGSVSSTVASDPRVEQLAQAVEKLVADRNQELTSRQQERINEGYETSFSELVKKLPETVTERDKEYITLKAKEMLWKDPGARERVAKGTYVDVPKYFAKASSLVTAETKAAAQTETERRAGVQSRGERTVIPAAEPVGGTPANEKNADPIMAGLSAEEAAALRDYGKR